MSVFIFIHYFIPIPFYFSVMDPKEDLDELTKSFAKDLRAATPINPIDPLQPNITYRDPSIGGYHSRCSSALSDIHGFSIDTYSSEVSILFVNW